jgi:hypothetical protein
MKKVGFTIIAMLFSVLIMKAQEVEVKKNSKEEKLYFKVKEGAKPAIYVDGKKFNFPIELIDQTRIQSMSVLTNENAVKLYNEPNGVILITTKTIANINASEFRVEADKSLFLKNEPIVILDGKVTTQEILKKLNPDNIESVDVVKGEKALKEYNAPNGVIIIVTKKKEKE